MLGPAASRPDERVLIVGGGVSGLRLAQKLTAARRPFLLLEARDRLGGRVRGEAGFDLGPAWFWPGQPRMAAVVRSLGLRAFPQSQTGRVLFEQAGRVGTLPRRPEAPWLRIEGGMEALVRGLASTLPPASLRTGAEVRGLELVPGGVTLELRTSAGSERVHGSHVVLAIPPRLVARLALTPALPGAFTAELNALPTWMAGTAKALARYETPFWRDAGLSGAAFSTTGPLQELHDASLPSGGAALVGFLLGAPSERADVEALKGAIRAQLTRLFGPKGAEPTALHVVDWAREPFTATSADATPLTVHPRYGLSRTRVLEGRVLLSGTETDARFGGYLEGALASAERAFEELAGS